MNLTSHFQISEEIKLCERADCGYLRPPRRGILKDIIVSGKGRFTRFNAKDFILRNGQMNQGINAFNIESSVL